jgi:hypothetical protein
MCRPKVNECSRSSRILGHVFASVDVAPARQLATNGAELRLLADVARRSNRSKRLVRSIVRLWGADIGVFPLRDR